MSTRNFKLIGTTATEDAAGTITINGTEVFNGPFIQNSITDPATAIATGSLTFDDTNEVVLPVTITITAGSAGIGMFQWNCATFVPNPAYTSEQYAVLTNPASTIEEKIAVWSSVADPAFSSADITVLETETDDELIKDMLRAHNCTRQLPDETSYAYGRSEETISDNRNAIFINGTPIAVPDWYYLTLSNTDVLTFDTIIFKKWY